MSELSSPLLASIAGIEACFGASAEPSGSVALEQLPIQTQVHGTQFHWRSPAQTGSLDGDAFGTRSRGVWVGVRTADCVPILLARRDGQAVAAIHAGWRGTVAGITDLVLRELKQEGENLSQWCAAIGPHIRECCYSVGEEVFTKTRSAFPELDPGRFQLKSGHYSLEAVHRWSLERHGLGAIESISACTCCSQTKLKSENVSRRSEFRFFSYRRDATSLRQWSLIRILP